VTSRGVGTLTTATILFTDIVNSAAMRARLGEESAEDHFRQFFSLQRSVTTAHGAVFIKSPLPSRSMQLLRVHKLSTRRTGGTDEPIIFRAALSNGDVSWTEDDVMRPPTIEAVRVARRWHSDIFEAGRMNVADEILGPGFVLHMPDQEIQGPNETKQLATALRASFPDLQITQEDVVASGNKVAIRWTARGTHRGPYPAWDVKITGREIHMRGIDCTRLTTARLSRRGSNGTS
jgi:hypothetical protein